MGGATRFATLLSAPPLPLRPCVVLLHCLSSSFSANPLRLPTLSSSSKIKFQIPKVVSSFHTQTSNNSYTVHFSAQHQQQQHPWPEWTQFLNVMFNALELSATENYAILPEDAFVVYEELPDDFVRVAAACLAFARARPNLLGLISRRDIEAVILNGTPFLFKSALDAARRMRAFLGTDESNVSESDKANTVDLMKYILSYASNPTVTSGRSGLYSRELVDSSVRNLLHELSVVSCRVPTGHAPNSDHQFSGRDGETPKPFGQNVEMKRGDWTCPRCNFMNFARNMKCLECEESRPRKQLTGREWECPQCNFFNHGRNLVCLRCDSRQPGAPLFSTDVSPSIPGLFKDSQFPEDSPNRTDTNNKEKEQAEKSERWFKRMAELHDAKDLPSAVSDEDFPEIMPMRKGENRFVVSKKKDRSLTSPKYKRQIPMDPANNSNFVPFVPFPPGYFARNDTNQSSNTNSPVNPASGESMSDTKKLDDPKSEMPDTTAASRNSQKPTSLEGSAVKEEPDHLDMSEEAKAERWFKRVAQIKDISELSQIPDEDFPRIMPMRKGVNRFVVSKRKTPLERRLITSQQQYRRNLPSVSDHSANNNVSDNS